MGIMVIVLALSAQAATQRGPYCIVQGEKLVPTGQASATNLGWYKSNEPLVLGKKTYVKYGMPQIMGVDDLQFWQSKDSVPVMIKADGDSHDIVYVQSSTTLCEFQPYRITK